MKILYFDIETSLMEVYTFYTGSKVNIQHQQIKEYSKVITICYSWGHENKVHSLEWDMKKKCDAKLLSDFNKIANEADVIIGHNGDKFDIATLRARIAVLGLESPWCETCSFDTLKDYRRVFRFPSNKLDAIARMLGEGQKNPMSLQDWIDIQNGSDVALKKMVKYCKEDVRLLKRIHRRLDKYVTPTEGNRKRRQMASTAVSECPECGGHHIIKYGHYTYKGQCKQKYMCKDCYKVIMPKDQAGLRVVK